MIYSQRTFKPTVTVGMAYHDHDVVGELLVFDFGTNKINGHIRNVGVIDNNNNKRMPFTLHFFDDLPSSIADHDEYLPAAADLAKLIGSIVVDTKDYRRAGLRSYVMLTDLQLDYELTAKEIYAYAVCMGGTPTYETSGDLTFKLGVYINI